MNKSRRLGPIAVLAVGALALTSCAAEAPPERATIVMGMASSDTYTAEWWGWLAASNLGYYDELGLDVTFQGVGGSGDQKTERSDSADHGIISSGVGSHSRQPRM
jgi:ABC-type nitrate/sulfonate/bicarbonate transport system substrate-binding protein